MTSKEIRNLLDRNKKQLIFVQHRIDPEKWFDSEFASNFKKVEKLFKSANYSIGLVDLCIDFGLEFFSPVLSPKKVICKPDIIKSVPIFQIILPCEIIDFQILDDTGIKFIFNDIITEKKFHAKMQDIFNLQDLSNFNL